jgi:hypothetical protein
VPVDTAKFTLLTEVMLALRKTLVTCVRFSDVRLVEVAPLEAALELEELLDEPVGLVCSPAFPVVVPLSVGLVVSPVLLEAASLSAGLVVSPVLLEAASLSVGFPAAAGLLPLPTVP